MRRSHWLLLALLGALTIGAIVLTQPLPRSRGAQMAYSDLIAEIANGNVRDAVVAGREVWGQLRDGRGLSVYLPVDPDRLVEKLIASGARVIGRPAEDDVNPLLNYVLAWVPYLLWLLAFRYIGVRIVPDRDTSAKVAALEARLATFEAERKSADRGS